jgi:predicted nucleic acid-binding protein
VASERVALDTGAMMLNFAGDKHMRELIAGIQNGSIESHTCELNVAELFYKTCEMLGSEIAAIRTTAIRESRINVQPVGPILTERAGSLKCKYRGMISLADAYLLATSIEFRCRLVTTDTTLKKLNLVQTTLLPVP